MTYARVPGFVSEKEAYGETTIVVDPARLVDASVYLRDDLGFNVLSDISSADYLGWGEWGVAGYIGTAGGRSINQPGSQGFQRVPDPKPKRFAMNYHLLSIPARAWDPAAAAVGANGAPRRLRVQVWLDDGEAVPSVIEVWPTADWHEREAWDMMGIRIDGHPNLTRLLMDEDWEGHPQRKDYPIGGEPVRFSGEE
ncbi:MAG: NADH-quinone oxidoreductase subunit C [Actinomycetota bacterium]|nr:NADH-quinone oxidoreductase subunit C [Actinomycetota bacterium]